MSACIISMLKAVACSRWTGGAGDLERGVGTAGTAARRGHSWQDRVKPLIALGSVAEAVVRAAPCSVLTVRLA